MHRVLVRSFSGFAVATLLVAADAAAQTPPPATSAEQLFQEGRLAMQQGRYEEACPKLEASQRAEPAAGTLLNLAECYEKAKRIASAYDTYTEARDAAQKRGKTEWEKLASDRISALAPRLPRLRISGKIPQGATLELDGRPYDRASIGKATPVDAGSHRVSVVEGVRELFLREVSTKESATTDVVIEIQDVPSGPHAPGTPVVATPPQPRPQPQQPPSTVDPQPASSGPSPLVWVLGGAAVVGAGVGTALLLVRNGQVSDATDSMKAVPCVDGGTAASNLGKCQSLADGVMGFAPPTIAFVAGGVFALSAVALYVATSPSGGTAKAARARARAMCMPGFGGAACVVNF